MYDPSGHGENLNLILNIMEATGGVLSQSVTRPGLQPERLILLLCENRLEGVRVEDGRLVRSLSQKFKSEVMVVST